MIVLIPPATAYGLTSPHSCRDENHGNGSIFEYRGCRVAQEQPLAWPAAHAHHDQIAAIALGLGENGLALRAAFYDRPDLLIVLAGIAGFIGIAVVSTAVGQYFVVGVICAIATYWLTLANDNQRPVH